ncbi:GNAT family N-acetyltransferase [Aeromicrobium sp. CF3.5]|uniref:GNAT family N-acetyltransferase n=1 Tax=Aeromicrobium sp. CF3.5 TaxID=3373078 RepID=UPI003EE7D482
MTDQPLISKAGDTLAASDVYGIWKIRDAVFAVEQQCDEPDVDDQDLLEATHHLWFEDAEGPTSYVRLLTDPDGARRVGRVCTRREHRGAGQSGRLVQEVTRVWGDGVLHLNAQAHLEDWYGRFGYVRTGENFMEAGIDHVPMQRDPGIIR